MEKLEEILSKNVFHMFKKISETLNISELDLLNSSIPNELLKYFLPLQKISSEITEPKMFIK